MSRISHHDEGQMIKCCQISPQNNSCSICLGRICVGRMYLLIKPSWSLYPLRWAAVSRHPASDGRSDDGDDDLATGSSGSRGDTVSCGDLVPSLHPSSRISSSIDLHHSAPYWDHVLIISNQYQAINRICIFRPYNVRKDKESQQKEAFENQIELLVIYLSMWVFDEVGIFFLLISSNEEKRCFTIIKVFWRSVLSVNVCVFIPWIFIISVRCEV